MIKIDLLVVVNQSMESCEAGLCREVIDWGAQIMDELGNIIGGTVFWIKYPEHENVRELAITTSPTIVFIDSDTKKSITRLSGSQINPQNYQKILRELNTASFLPDSGNFTTENGYSFGAIGESSFGLNPFGFNLLNLELPPLVLLIGSILSGYKALDSRSGLGQVAFGGTSAYLFYQWKKSKAS